MSIGSEITDYWVSDLTENVDGLADVQTHVYTSRSIESLLADGRKHLAVWPVDTGPQQRPAPYDQQAIQTTGSLNTEYNFAVLYWEPSSEAENTKADEDAAADLLQLADDMRARFLSQTNRSFLVTGASVWRVDWAGTNVDTGGTQSSGLVRSIALGFTAQVSLDYTD